MFTIIVMIIVLFQVLYIFGKLIYNRYTSRKQSHDIVDKECPHANMNISFRDRNQEILAQPPGDNSDDEKDMETCIKFFPPAYIQRYVTVQKILEDPRYKGKIRKVVDFGCSELGFMVYLKNTPGVEEILCVDVDKEVLEWSQKKAHPLHVDYLHTRDKPLTISVLEGSVTHNDKLLEKTDAVICIELIEHLYPDTLTDLPDNIFGYIKPQVAVMTTPNADFNVLFNKPGFRHYDHKFEWTREQFQDWAENIVLRYPDYEVSFSGICEGPAGSEDLGCCSQMSVFHRRTTPNELIYSGVEGLFNIITIQEYPFHVDNRSDEQKILDDTVYYIRNYGMYSLEYSEEVPLVKLLDPLKKYNVSVESLKELLEHNGWRIVARENGPVVLIPEPSDSDNSSGENWDDLEFSWNDQEVVEDDWDLDPGPPTSRTNNFAGDAISKEDWSQDPAIIMVIKQEEEEPRPTCSNQVPESSSEVKNESLSDNQEKGKPIENSSPLTFSFKNVVDNSTELIPHKLYHSDYESQSVSGSTKSERITPNDKVRKTYRKSQIKSQDSPSVALDELGSLCSIYLESSRNDNSKTCFQDLSNLSFESTLSATSSLNCSKLDDNLSQTDENLSSKKAKFDGSFSKNTSIQFRTVQEIEDELRRKYIKDKNSQKAEDSLHESDLWEGLQTPESISRDFSESSSQISLPNFNSSNVSSSSLEKSTTSDEMYKSTPLDLMKNNLQTRNTADNTPNSSNVHINACLDNSSSDLQGSSKNVNKNINSKDSKEMKNFIYLDDKEKNRKCETVINEMEVVRDYSEFERMFARCPENYVFDDSCASKVLDLSDVSEMNPVSCEILDTPPNSSSPEIMDSGYPNSTSVHDMTPEYDLPSIEQDRISHSESPSIEHDRISDSESPSIEEAPRPGFHELELENGDLANNNRDDEGNNMIAAEENDNDDLQPLIHVLANDRENENDIYVLQNGFPAWLLRILRMQEMGIGQVPHFGLLDPADDGEADNLNINEDFSSSSEDD